ncbi:MAG: hypothetical protein AB8H03_19385 [Saprospiraceae bacterium]
MKNLFLIFSIVITFPIFSFSQDDNPLEYYKLVLGESDNDFEVTEAPAEWKDESAVILCQKTYISFLGSKRRKGTKTKGITRKRVLIQDQTALDDYSEYHYQSSDAVGLFIIKPDGKKEEIDISKAVKVETDVPRSYASSYQSSDYYKIAIPNLAIGDILDYFKVFTEEYTSDVNIIAPISSYYPIKYQELIFDLEKRWKFRYNSFNGAPDFIQDTEGGVNAKGKKSAGVSRFIIKDEMRSTYKDVMWDYENLTEPIIKIMASPIPKGVKLDKNTKRIQQGTTFEDLFKSLTELKNMPPIVSSRGYTSGVYTMGNYINDLKFSGDSDEEVAAKIYYALRLGFIHQMANYSVTPTSTNKRGIQAADSKRYKKLLTPEDYYKMSDNYFAYYFNQQLQEERISSEFVVAVPRFYGDLESVVLNQEVVIGIYIPTTKKYYWPFDNYLSAGEMDSRLFNTTVYHAHRLYGFEPSKETTPTSNYRINSYINNIDLKIKDDNNDLEFTHKVQFRGAYKQRYYGLLLYQEKYVDEDDERIALGKIKIAQKKIDQKVNKRKKKKNRISEEDIAEIKSELSEQKKENIKDWIKQDFDTEEIKEFKVISNGRFGDDLKAQIKYDAKDYIKKAGPNLIFDIGKMIGSQIELDEDDLKDRTKNIEINYAKTIKNNITLELPEGYKAEGVENLNMSVDNEFGAFISEAKMEGNLLKVSTKKIYKNQTVPAKEWSKMIEMLELAFKFSQQKIILKK